jgi:acyl-CoA thioester hydrolase
MKHQSETRARYGHFYSITTRSMDKDASGHVNNALYYSRFETVLNQSLISHGALHTLGGAVIDLVVETLCNYISPVAFPDAIIAGLRVAHVGTCSVRCEIGLFREDDVGAAAQENFTHVYVERDSRRPTTLPNDLRAVLTPLMSTP